MDNIPRPLLSAGAPISPSQGFGPGTSTPTCTVAHTTRQRIGSQKVVFTTNRFGPGAVTERNMSPMLT